VRNGSLETCISLLLCAFMKTPVVVPVFSSCCTILQPTYHHHAQPMEWNILQENRTTKQRTSRFFRDKARDCAATDDASTFEGRSAVLQRDGLRTLDVALRLTLDAIAGSGRGFHRLLLSPHLAETALVQTNTTYSTTAKRHPLDMIHCTAIGVCRKREIREGVP
jgi:hypothetical protein